MGNSSIRFIKFNLELEQSAIVAGDNVRGRVLVRVDSSTDDVDGGPTSTRVPATEIVLRLSGKEKATISRGAHNSVAERTLFSIRTTIRREDEWPRDAIPPGTYVFPFSIPTPAVLPSSVEFGAPGGDGSHCRIAYELKIDATPRGHDTIRDAARCAFLVRSAPLPDVRVPSSVAPHFIDVKSHGGMVGRGRIGITARVADVQIGRGDTLEVFIAAKNHASAIIRRVQVELVERVVWKAKRKTESRTKTIVTLSDVDLPSILRGKRSKNASRESTREWAARDEEALAFLHQELQLERHQVSLRVPSECNDSYGSTNDTLCMIRVVHELRITTYTRDFISNPSVTIPLQIGTRPVRDANSPRAETEPIEERNQISPDIHTTPINAEVVPVPIPNQIQPAMSGNGEALRVSTPSPPDTNSILIAEAFAIPVREDAIQFPEATATPEAMAVGGVAPREYSFTSNSSESISGPPLTRDREQPADAALHRSPGTSFNSENPITPIPTASPSIDALVQEMLYSVNDYDIIRTKLQDNEWKSVLAAITPEEFGCILSHVNRDTDQPNVAVLIATEAFERGRFTCEYGRAAVLSSADCHRQAMVALILPHCVDARANCGIVREVLSEWDRIITKDVFDCYTDE